MSDTPGAPTTADKKAAIENLTKKLNRAEEKTAPGANLLTPKQALLDARAVQERHPDKRIRWVSLKNPDKALVRHSQGYSVIPEAEGGRRLGDDSVLMYCDRKVYEDQVRANDKLHKSRLKQHKTEMVALAESLVRQLHDVHGIDIDLNRFLVNED